MPASSPLPTDEYRGIGVNAAQMATARRIMGDHKIAWFEPASHQQVAFRCWCGPPSGGAYVTSLIGRDGAIVDEFADRPIAGSVALAD
jgi:hypothetical protein